MVGRRSNKPTDAQPSEEVIRRLLLREYDGQGADWLWQTDQARRIVHPSDAFATACGLTAEHLSGRPFLQVLAGSTWDSGNFSSGLRELAERLKSREAFRDLLLPVYVDDHEMWWEISAQPYLDKKGEFRGFIGVGSNVTGARESADKINRVARFDTVTGLPNRILIQEAANEACKDAAKWGSQCGLSVVAITNLDEIKASRGYNATEEMLIEIAKNLGGLASENCLIGQISPSEFVAIWRDSTDTSLIEESQKRLVNLARGSVGGRKQVDISSGYASAPEDANTGQELIAAALDQIYPVNLAKTASIRRGETPARTSAANYEIAETFSDEQRHAILAHGPPAEAGLGTLIAEHRLRLHNGPPEALLQAELDRLEELRRELQNLVILASEGAKVEKKFGLVSTLTARVFKFSSETGELFVAGLKPFLASAPLAIGTLVLLQAVCSPTVGNLLAPGAALAVLAGHYGYDVKRAKKTDEADKPDGD
jgi:diguanylate cyclase (GGDEF)-like protein/PAS domain S-box-containing protein